MIIFITFALKLAHHIGHKNNINFWEVLKFGPTLAEPNGPASPTNRSKNGLTWHTSVYNHTTENYYSYLTDKWSHYN